MVGRSPASSADTSRVATPGVPGRARPSAKKILAGCETIPFGGIMGAVQVTCGGDLRIWADMSGGDSGPYAGPKIGRTLELARKELGLSLEQVEDATKIRAGYLRDLERENFDVLPAVYVQGSLKTYANFLQLDAEAMVRELKRRQTPQEKPPYPLYVGPQEDDSLDDILTAVGGAAGSKSRAATEEDRAKATGPPLLPAGVGGYLYLGSAVFLILVVAAVALALNAAGDRRPAVSQVRDPLISQAPETSPPDAVEEARVQKPQQGAEDEKDAQRERPAGPQDKDDEKDKEADQAAQTGQDQSDPSPAQNTASATATASASAERDAQKASAEPVRRSPASVRASAPARPVGAAPPSSPRPTGRSGGGASGGDGELRVKVVVGGKDPVQLTGGPFDD